MATITTQSINLSLTPGTVYPVLHVSQGDTGLEALVFKLYQNGQPFQIPDEVTAVHIDGGTPGGAFSYDVDGWSGNTVTATLTATMTAEAGVCLSEIVLLDTTLQRIGSCNFAIIVEESPFVKAHVSATELATLLALVEGAQQDALLSKSWAVGDTGVRSGEDTDNSKYWAELSEQYANEVSYKKVYESVAEMVADTELAAEAVCRTTGYYSNNDGGGALYRISSTEPSTFYETLESGLYAEMILPDVVTPEMFGAVGDGSLDDAPAFRLAFAVKRPIMLLKHYKISTLLKIPDTSPIVSAGGYLDVTAFDTDTQTGGWVFFDNPKYNILPEWFGAVGDGVADDTKAIQNCVDALLDPDVFPIGKTQTEVGREHTQYNYICVEFTKNYVLSNKIVIRAEAHFNKLNLFSNKGAKIIGAEADPSDFVDSAFYIEKPDNYPAADDDTQTYKYFNGLAISRFVVGINDRGTDLDCAITNCMFMDCSDAGVLLYGCDGTLVENNYGCWGLGYLVRLLDSNGCRVLANHCGEVDSNGQLGIKVENGSNEGNIIANNVLKNCGITVTNRKYNSDQIVNNNIYGAALGIYIEDSCTGVLVSGNNVRNCTTGIRSYKESVIESNIINNCTVGILLWHYGESNLISGNQIKSCATGIENQTANYRNQFIGNKIIGSSVIGISAGFTGAYSFAADNSFIDCTAVHDFTSGSNEIAFAYNYSTQKGMVLGPLLN